MAIWILCVPRWNKQIVAFTQQVEETLAQLRHLDTSIEVAKMAALGSKLCTDTQDQQSAALSTPLAQETEERSALAEPSRDAFSTDHGHAERTKPPAHADKPGSTSLGITAHTSKCRNGLQRVQRSLGSWQ